jgi:hypothetical protein
MAMGQTQRQVKLGFTDERFPAGTHMCLVYDDDDERRRLIGRFIDAGLRDEERVAYFADTTTPIGAAVWLSEAGVDVSGYIEAGMFSVS